MPPPLAPARSPSILLPLPRRLVPPHGPDPVPGEPGVETLSALLWAGFGLHCHGSGGRTATCTADGPLEVYALLPGGGYRYQATEHALQRVTDVDARPVLARKGGDRAGLHLVYVTCEEDGGEDEARGCRPTDSMERVAARIAAWCERAGLVAATRSPPPALAPALALQPPRRAALVQSIASGHGMH